MRGFTAILLEHIMMTSVAASISESESNEANELKRRTLDHLRDSAARARVSLQRDRELVELYVDAVLDGGDTTPVSSEGERCSWVLGCPCSPKPLAAHNPGLRGFCKLENDHVFPRARRTLMTEGTTGQKLCAYHNREWKRAHIAFSLQEDWFAFSRSD
jgi:hypothetical protein